MYNLGVIQSADFKRKDIFMIKFEIVNNEYVSKVSGQVKQIYNLYMYVNGVRVELNFKGDMTTFNLIHSLMSNCEELTLMNKGDILTYEEK